MSKLEEFNSAFPNSEYREIHAQYIGDDIKQYQASKAPINSKRLNFEEIKTTNNRIGWIVPKEFVVIDVDELVAAKKVFDILNGENIKFTYMKGRKGAHFILKNSANINNGAHYMTALGINIDTRSKEKGYIVLPHNDTERSWGKNLTSDVDDVPSYFIPLKDLKVNDSFIGMKNGDARNTKLFEHFLNLKDYAPEIQLDDKIKAIEIINKYLFKDPLDDNELNNTVLRDSVVNKKSIGRPQKQAIKDEEIASKIVDELVLITCNDILYKYNGKFYKPIYKEELERIIHSSYNCSLPERNRLEIIKFIKLKTWIAPEMLNRNWNEIVVKNGILNLTDMLVHPFSAESYNTIYIDMDYDPEVEYSNTIDNFMNMISEKQEDKKELLYQIVGYCFLKKPLLGKFFIIYGDGATGKSTYLKMIANLVGEEYTSYLDLQDLETRFLPAEMFGKLLNIGDDLPFKTLGNSSTLKKMVTGEVITAEQKFGQPFTFANFATMIFATNKLPPISDKTTGLYRRLMIISINKVIDNPDPFFLQKITRDDYRYLFYKAIQAVRKAITNNGFTMTPEVRQELKIFEHSQSSLLTFLDEYVYTKESLNLRSVNDLYYEYSQFCDNSGYKSLNKLNFKKEVCSALKMEVVNTTYNGENQGWRFR